MITNIQLLRSIGQFDHVPAGAIDLRHYVLVYAENGRGKTTLSAILRSLSTGDSLPIHERRRLAAANPPQAVLAFSDAPFPSVFERGAWSRTLPNIAVFDDRFVEENVCSGLNVGATHRQNLHTLVIGSRGVTLNRQLQALVERIEQHNTELRRIADMIPGAAREGLSVDDFCNLENLENVDALIQIEERNLAAAEQQDAIRNAPEIPLLEVPRVDAERFESILALDLPGLDQAAVNRVQGHFASLGRGGEVWAEDGMPRIVHEGDRELCPFCRQDLDASAILASYRDYFSRQYGELKNNISAALQDLTSRHARDFPGRFERGLRNIVASQQFWSRFCDVPVVELQSETVLDAWRASSEAVQEALRTKLSTPLEPLTLSRNAREAIAGLESASAEVSALNRSLEEANSSVRAVKEGLARVDSRAISSNLDRLRATRDRHSRILAGICDEYLAERTAKGATELRRDQVRQALEAYRTEEFPLFRDAVNEYLARFGAGYRIGQVASVDTRGGATCNYDVLINDTPISVSGAVLGPAEPSFRSVLSSGDRNTLALAFFLAALGRDPNLQNKIIVVDDPASSLDENRSLTTVQELRRLGERVDQIMILSHDKNLLCRIWSKIDHGRATSIRLSRDGNGSSIEEWDISSDSQTDHDRNHSLVRAYLENGPGSAMNSRTVAIVLRPILEAFLRVAFPAYFRPGPNGMGNFRGICGERCGTPGEILTQSELQELDNLLEYANLFHHNTNPDWETAAVIDGELRGFASRVLGFCKK